MSGCTALTPLVELDAKLCSSPRDGLVHALDQTSPAHELDFQNELDELLRRGEDLNGPSRVYRFINGRTCREGRTPLTAAVSAGNVEAVRRLLAAKVEVNAIDGYGYSPLREVACESTCSPWYERDSLEGERRWPLQNRGAHEWYLRVCERKLRIAELVLNAGADKEGPVGTEDRLQHPKKPVLCALQRADARMLELFLQAGDRIPDSDLAAFFNRFPDTRDQRDAKHAIAALLRSRGVAVPYDEQRDAGICYTAQGRLCSAGEQGAQ